MDVILVGSAQPTWKLFNWWRSLIWAVVPQTLITSCYHFDFDHATFLPANQVLEGEILQQRKTSVGFPSVCLPKHITRNFSKPYYVTSLMAWCAGNLLLLALIDADVVSLDAEDYRYGFVNVRVTIPLMVLALVGLAAMRGELQKMWSYKKSWHIVPRDSVDGHTGTKPKP